MLKQCIYHKVLGIIKKLFTMFEFLRFDGVITKLHYEVDEIAQTGDPLVDIEVITQQTRLRKFCVDIAPPFIARNIDAALLREHSVRRVCAHYKFLQNCANLTHASTHTLNLRKKIARNI